MGHKRLNDGYAKGTKSLFGEIFLGFLVIYGVGGRISHFDILSVSFDFLYEITF